MIAMKYISVKEAASKWGISVRRVQVLCKHKKIDGIFRIGNAWVIPADAVKPKDARKKENRQRDKNA